ncbi:hypothetical protein [Serratia marcescens]|uniref:hypothetical protein n=1 Tax=Serratia marcescens TaxID=615 RepID=UPI001F153551|nr:hypothetical protein [Serratia marcescens]
MKEELYGLANHIAGAKGGLPQDWQDWANEIETDLRRLANREAQPVAYLNKFSGVCMTLEQQPNAANDAAVYVPLYTAPPAPAYPERLPCPVHLLPGLKFGKGVPTRSMLDALVRRAEYEAELEAMTPEQKAEDNARIEAFKALLPKPPAPAVPDELLDAMEEVIRISDRDHEAWDKAKSAITACRAAMLAQPVSSGYKLPDGFKLMPLEMTDEIGEAIAMEARCCGGIALCIYEAALAAAPEGGNDHDTRR